VFDWQDDSEGEEFEPGDDDDEDDDEEDVDDEIGADDAAVNDSPGNYAVSTALNSDF